MPTLSSTDFGRDVRESTWQGRFSAPLSHGAVSVACPPGADFGGPVGTATSSSSQAGTMGVSAGSSGTFASGKDSGDLPWVALWPMPMSEWMVMLSLLLPSLVVGFLLREMVIPVASLAYLARIRLIEVLHPLLLVLAV